jgi:archaellum component FlaC
MSTDAEFQRGLYNHMSSLIDSMQGLNRRLMETITLTDRFDVEFAKISRHNNQFRQDMIDLKSEVAQLRGEVAQVRGEVAQVRADLDQFRDETRTRLDSLFHRIDDLETAVSDNSRQIKTLTLDVTSHSNEILNAVQGGLQNKISLEELVERIEALERRVGRS